MKKSLLLLTWLAAFGAPALATTFITEYVPPAAPGGALPSSPAASNQAPGLYLQVLDGQIVMSNPSGNQNFAAGQFGYVPSLNQPPVLVPANPGMQFAPPPSFGANAPGSVLTGAANPNSVDCVVR